MAQHATLTVERWSSFSPVQQILMIANEMNRAKRLFSPLDKKGVTLCYERILYLTDLTIQSNPRRGFRKELLRWRDLAAEEYLSLSRNNGISESDMNRHLNIFRILLLMNPESAKQISMIVRS
ncbi:MAG: hypothetical protein HY266_08360 [Deltaproteobacteria bacterium]|nr:hypothetical protein [Deltaproteobacteria bacterium]